MDREFLLKIIKILPGHIYLKDKDLRFIGCNLNQAKDLGYDSPDALLGKSGHDLLEKDDADRVLKVDTEVVKNKRSICTEELTEDLDGNDVIYLSQKVPILDDETGEVLGLAGVSFDITERKRRLDDLQGSQFALDTIIGYLPGHVFWKDLEGRYLGCNDLQAKTLGLSSRHELVGKTVFDVLSKDDAEVVHQTDQAILNSGKEQRLIETYTSADGSRSTYLSQKVPLRDKHDNTIGIMGISLDITEQKKMEEELIQSKQMAEAATRQKSEFISKINNTLRTPINNIALALEMLSKTSLTEQQKKYLQVIQDSNKGMLPSLVHASDYAKLEAGDIHLHFEPFSLADTLENIIEELSDIIYSKNLDIFIQLPQANQVYLNTSITRFIQIFKILMNIAIRDTHSGHIAINVEPCEQEAIITLEDTGQGITAERLHTIFDLVDDGTSLSVELPYCKKMLQHLGGDLDIKSTLTEGTQFIIRMPIDHQGPLSYQLSQAANTLKIAVVDDNKMRCNALKNRFSTQQTSCIPSNDLPKILAESPNIVLIDESVLDHTTNYLQKLAHELPKQTLIVLLANSLFKLPSDLRKARNVVVYTKPLLSKRLYSFIDSKLAWLHKPQPHVLVVEDDRICQVMTKEVLLSLNCIVDISGTGYKAIEEVKDHDYDLVFMDIGLPGINGLQTAERIKETLNHQCPPIVALTGLTSSIDIDTLNASGYFSAVLTKPATLFDIESAVQRLYQPNKSRRTV